MGEETPTRWHAPAHEPRPAQRFSTTKFIGGSLKALYDDDVRACPSHLTELLDELSAIQAGPNSAN